MAHRGVVRENSTINLSLEMMASEEVEYKSQGQSQAPGHLQSCQEASQPATGSSVKAMVMAALLSPLLLRFTQPKIGRAHV